jgi:lipoprotein
MISLQRALSAALLAAALLVGCSSKDPSAESSPSVVITAVSETADSFHITPPEGWVVIPVKSYEAMDYIASANGDSRFSAASLRVQHWWPEALRVALGRYSEKPLVIDMYGYRDSDIASAKTVDNISDIEVLPDRMIGGDRAVGYSYLQEKDGVGQRYEDWFVGRHDGVWHFVLNSAPGETVVPSEARAALDTVAWGPPGSATPTVRES